MTHKQYSDIMSFSKAYETRFYLNVCKDATFTVFKFAKTE